MSAKHTPGPWHFVADAWNRGTYEGDGYSVGSVMSDDSKGDGMYVATLEHLGDDGGEDRAEQLANADLIAAAPTLLDALKRADEALRFHPHGDNRSGADRVLADLVIAKAEGRNA